MGMWSKTSPDRFTPWKEIRYPLCRELGGFDGRSGWVQKNLASTGIRSPNRPARSESLYRLSYRGPQSCSITGLKDVLNTDFGIIIVSLVGQDNSVGIAMRYNLDGPGIESRYGR